MNFVKKNRSFFKYILFGLCLTALFLTAVLLNRRADDKETYPITRVSVILPHKDDGYWNLIAEGISEERDALGAGCKIDINMILPQLNYNIAQMTDLLKQQIAAKVDYIVVQGNEDETFRDVLQDAWEQGIHVICVDTDISDFPEHLYVGTNNYEAGKLMGEELVELTGGSATVGIISGEEQYQNLQERLRGFQDVVQEWPDIEIKGVAYDKYDALTVMRLYHQMADEAEVMVFLEGTGGKSMESVYDGPGEEYEYVLGFDAYDGAKRRVLDGIVKQDTNLMGRQVVREIEQHIKTGNYSADCIYTDIFWLTAENYDEVMK